jgi:hypothetical protein
MRPKAAHRRRGLALQASQSRVLAANIRSDAVYHSKVSAGIAAPSAEGYEAGDLLEGGQRAPARPNRTIDPFGRYYLR